MNAFTSSAASQRLGVAGLFGIAVFVGLTFAAAVLAQTRPSGPPPPACTAPEFRQFDYWIGTWLVRNPAGKEIGKSEITKVASGCAIRESWQSGSGTDGMSINYYDPQDKQWHQHWVGSDGAILHLEGALQDGAMTLASEGKQGGASNTNRIVWTHQPDGKVKQEWSASNDGGKTWKTSFVGLYEH